MPYDQEKELGQLWEWLRHEDSLFAQRTSLLTVTQSMLLVAFTTIIASSSIALSKSVYVITLSSVGIATCLVWNYYGCTIDKYTIQKIKDILVVAPQFPNYKKILAKRKRSIN